MIALVYFNLYEKKAGQLGAEEEITESTVLSAYHAVCAEENQPMLFRGDLEGGLWSFRIFALSLSDPLAFVTSSISSLTINQTLLISILIPLLMVLVLGRFFCAWICPYSLLAEAGKGITRILRRLGLDYFRFDLPRHSARFYLIMSLILGAVVSLPITTLIYPPRIFTEAIYHLVVSGMITSGLIFLIFLWLGEMIFSPHLFCRRLCPGGALMSLLGRWRFWRVKQIELACDKCGVCSPVCPYKLNPAQGVFPGECDNCGLCIDACRGNDRLALEYSWSQGGTRNED
jgi:ferredoxin-type protein NapH